MKKKIIDFVVGSAFAGVILGMLANVPWFYSYPQPDMTLGCILSFAFGLVTSGALVRGLPSAKRKSSIGYTLLYGVLFFTGIFWVIDTYVYGGITPRASGWWWSLGAIGGSIMSESALASEKWQRRAMFASLSFTIPAIIYALLLAKGGPLPSGYSGLDPYWLMSLALLGFVIWNPPKRLYALVHGMGATVFERLSLLWASREERQRAALKREKENLRLRLQEITLLEEPGRSRGGPMRVAPILEPEDDHEAEEVESAAPRKMETPER